MFPLISLGPFSLPLPPLLLILGFWVGIGITDLKTKQSNIDPVFVEKLFWVTFSAGILGARLSFIGRNPSAFKGNLISVISLNPNLFDAAGGLLIAAAAGYLMISNSKYSAWEILDLLTPLFIILLFFLGLSQFSSGNNYGTVTTMPWGVNIWGNTRHPVQLYYAFADFIIYLFIQLSYPKYIKSSGKTFLVFSILTSSVYLIISAYQETQSVIAYGLHLSKILLWLIFTISLILYLHLNKPDSEERREHA